MFISHSDWKFGKYKYIKHNPGPGRNLLNKLDTQFIFDNNKFINLMKKVVGKNYRILDSKLVMGVPKYLIPKWILEMKKDSHTVNLGEFIKPKYIFFPLSKRLENATPAKETAPRGNPI